MGIFNFRPASSTLKIKNFGGVNINISGDIRDIVAQSDYLFALGSNFVWRYQASGKAVKLAYPAGSNSYKLVSSLGRLILHVQSFGFYTSDDNGDSWTLRSATGTIISGMDTNGTGTIAACEFSGSAGHYSLDNGTTWNTTTTGSGTSNAGNSQILKWHSGLSSFIRLATGQNLNVSVDGITYVPIDQSGLGYNDFNCQVVHNSFLYLGDTTGRLYRSSDAGVTLQELDTKTFYNKDSGLTTVALQCSTLASFENIIYSGHLGAAIQYSSDGVTFVPATLGTATSAGQKIVAFTEFNGELWAALNANLIKTLSE